MMMFLPDSSVSPEVDEWIDARMTQHDEQEHGVDVAKYVTEISNDNNLAFISFCKSHISILFLIKTEFLMLQHKKEMTEKS